MPRNIFGKTVEYLGSLSPDARQAIGGALDTRYGKKEPDPFHDLVAGYFAKNASGECEASTPPISTEQLAAMSIEELTRLAGDIQNELTNRQ